MRKNLNQIIKAVRGGEAAEIGGMSTGERCYIALATGRYDLLPDGFDPIEAWHRLDRNRRRDVCAWRGWPGQWAQDVEDLIGVLHEYGHHDPGCSADIDEAKYPCKCGWRRERQRIFGA